MSNRSAYICDNVRTPIGRYGGALAQVRADDLAAHPIKTLLQRNTGLNPSNIDEVILGCANQAGEDNRNVARMATLLAGAPDSIPGMTVNRLCGSGMDAVGIAARAIKTGELDLVIAGGVESMSRAPFVMPKAPAAFTRENVVYDTTIGWRFINTQFQSIYGIDSMPETAENVAAGFAISRLDQDKFALRSQQKAQASIDAGRLAMEIEPISIPQSKGEPIIVARDEHPRATTLEKLQSLRTPFKASGTVTAGNASGVNDGACAMLVASKTAAEANQLTPMAKVVTMATSGLEPRIMGFGPYQASIKALKQAGLTANDLNIIELNEAFASQGLAVLRALGIDDDDARVNPNGGAIALGHPLGMSGARIVMSAARELQLSGGRYALCTMCVGVGQGIAIILEAA
ncbi:beta-ketoadipyl-CoA thiolase [Vibrio crassostreae]|uniref:Beta-ketoadipyl-CoA thiolase n=1 Tax=Vibrio crassostreae TaxID=246167 RepID=A0A822N0W0_9VIBR|nr:3-oxoadipyl-CoA thiolase [Vibrio crassostreae]MDH5951622.1 3-oxoadipyl-CoA thiolase [Vibrio crassostreae]ROO49604.1 acetyl-CoA acyltransferase [Vibrio crassostreae]TCN04680.1 acetyl-CoA acyltransferase [Vibrio crassostreae]TCU06740.1 acetyl-CoA acyltransferase [Vibrio crassostreae]CAK2105945.1 beta-ketoadipyl-CoA thiolase [Vibrio crassostreae]